MAKVKVSGKRLQIDKANARMVLIISVASFIVAFSLVASKALLDQRSYQSRVIKEKETTLKQLEKNVEAVNTLMASYQEFASATDNVLGGNPQGTGDKDGDNPKIVLDALPSKYDFPALTTSLEKLLSDKSYKIESITGTDDEVNQGAAKDSNEPKPVEVPFQIAVSGPYPSIQGLVGTLENSIRPIQITKMDISGADTQLKLNVTAKTFYQPEKSLNISTKVVK